MKEWNRILDYIENLIYVEEEEEIIVKHSSNSEAALDIYNSIISGMDENEKWKVDIAIDCVRTMSDEDRAYVCDHMRTTDYHFGYAMGIRNKYIHGAKKHRHFEADGISSSVMTRIFTIVSPVYDYRNEDCVSFFNSIEYLMEQYGEEYHNIFDEVVERLFNKEEGLTAKTAFRLLGEKLREANGREGFAKLLAKSLKQFEEEKISKDREDWFWKTNFPGVKAVLYPLEANQMNALRELGLYSSIERYSIKSLEECRAFIDEKLGLRDDYAEYMAWCAWEVCNPIANGKWRTLSTYQLDLSYALRSKLSEVGVENLGDLCDKSFEELCDNPEIGKHFAEKLRDKLQAMGLEFAK